METQPGRSGARMIERGRGEPRLSHGGLELVLCRARFAERMRRADRRGQDFAHGTAGQLLASPAAPAGCCTSVRVLPQRTAAVSIPPTISPQRTWQADPNQAAKAIGAVRAAASVRPCPRPRSGLRADLALGAWCVKWGPLPGFWMWPRLIRASRGRQGPASWSTGLSSTAGRLRPLRRDLPHLRPRALRGARRGNGVLRRLLRPGGRLIVLAANAESRGPRRSTGVTGRGTTFRDTLS